MNIRDIIIKKSGERQNKLYLHGPKKNKDLKGIQADIMKKGIIFFSISIRVSNFYYFYVTFFKTKIGFKQL